MSVERLVFWEPCLSPHKHDLLNALVTDQLLAVVCCAEKDLPQDRLQLGWAIEGEIHYDVHLQPDVSCIERLVLTSKSSSLHVFSGVRWVPSIVAGLAAVKKHRAAFVIMSEPRVLEGFRGLLRLLQSRLTERRLQKDCKAILAIGRNGPHYFRIAGYPPSRIFPFAYFSNAPKSNIDDESRAFSARSDGVNVGYVGRLIAEKGILDIVDAMTMLCAEASLSIVGRGPLAAKIAMRSSANGVTCRLLGVIPNAKIGAIFDAMDVLVLASTTTDDGWGVVVNEALMSGVAVVATTCVGASALLTCPEFGALVPAHDPKAIAAAITRLQAGGAFQRHARSARACLARAKLSPEAGAATLRSIVQWIDGGRRPPDLFEA